jgi:TRAP-type C4-dicarboxylate transport system permease small subunit
MGRLERLFVEANRVVVVLALAAIFVIVFLNVVLRYGFGWSFSWAEETARFLMVFGVFAGAGLALREGRLVEIDLFVALLPRPLRLAVRWATVLAMAAFMAALLWLGIEFVAFGWPKETMATQIPRGIPYLALPLGAALFLVHLALFAARYVRELYLFVDLPDEPAAGPEGR